MNSIVSAEITFKNGEQKIREWAAQFGPIVQYLPPHFTLLYGCNGFEPNLKKFLSDVLDPNIPIYKDVPKPIGFDIFFNKKKNYNALAIKYEWLAGKAMNTVLASDNDLFPQGIESGFNDEKYQAHVTVAYIDANIPLDKNIISAKINEIGLSFFDLTVVGITLEISAKPKRN